MKHQIINELHRFDLRDRWWVLDAWDEQDLRLRISHDGCAWELEGKCIGELLVTFRDFHMNWANTTQNNEDVPLSFGEAMKLWQSDDFFVFAYYLEGNSCEICGLGSDGPLAMNFSFDGTLVEWEDDERTFEGTLTKL